MASLKNKKFEVKQPVTEKYVKDNHFTFSKDLSSSKIQIYTYSFPVQKFADITLMSCVIKIAMGKKDVDIEVLKSDGSMYPDWYSTRQDINHDLVDQINASILGKFRKLDIEEISRFKEDRDAHNDKRRVSEVPVSEGDSGAVKGENPSEVSA